MLSTAIPYEIAFGCNYRIYSYRSIIQYLYDSKKGGAYPTKQFLTSGWPVARVSAGNLSPTGYQLVTRNKCGKKGREKRESLVIVSPRTCEMEPRKYQQRSENEEMHKYVIKTNWMCGKMCVNLQTKKGNIWFTRISKKSKTLKLKLMSKYGRQINIEVLIFSCSFQEFSLNYLTM